MAMGFWAMFDFARGQWHTPQLNPHLQFALQCQEAEPALAFFSLDFGGRSGAHQLVLETEPGEGGAQIVLKLDFDGQTWKRVRKKARAA